MPAACATGGLIPADVSLVACHAPGTPLGDATELLSMAQVFKGCQNVPIASLKSNMGHLITASGVAGLLKVLAAMRAGERAPSIHVNDETRIDAFEGSPFRLLQSLEAWTCKGPRRAAINNFGFGGNNAHLIVEEPSLASPAVPWIKPGRREDVAIVAMSTLVGSADEAAFADAVLHGRILAAKAGDPVRASEVQVPLKKIRFPPNDLGHTLPQQLMILQAGFALNDTIDTLDKHRTMVLLGMQCDAEIARYGARWRMDAEEGRDGVVQGLVAAGVIGTMPNVVANRLNSQFDLRGPSFTISSEEASGTVALQLAADALRRGDVDAALVGAVDVCCEPVHARAVAMTLAPSQHHPGDAAIMLVMKRRDDALRDGDRILAVLPDRIADDPDALHLGAGGLDRTPQMGHAHAASGLLHVAAGVLALHHRVKPALSGHPAQPWLPGAGPRRARITTEAMGGQATTTWLEEAPGAGARVWTGTPQQPVRYAAETLEELIARLQDDRPGGDGMLRAAWVPPTDSTRRKRALSQAADTIRRQGLRPGVTSLSEGLFVGDAPMTGDVAFVFSGPAGAYPQMGRDLLLAMPELVDALAAGEDNLAAIAGWIYAKGATRAQAPADVLWGASFLSQIHARLTQEFLGLRPDATIGFCSGETNALYAMGAWRGLSKMALDLRSQGVFDVAMSGRYETVRRSWGLAEDAPVNWASYRVLAPVETVRAAVADEPRCHLTIINAPGDVVIAGEGEACERVLETIGPHRGRDLGYNLAIHCEEARAFRQPYWEVHHRPTHAVEGVRFYAHALPEPFTPTAEIAAQTLTDLAMGSVDFPALVERAYADGVRIFIEHGPQAGCTKWIGRILGDRPHLAVALDRYSVDSISQISRALSALWCAGVDVDLDRWTTLLALSLIHISEPTRPY